VADKKMNERRDPENLSTSFLPQVVRNYMMKKIITTMVLVIALSIGIASEEK